MILYHIYCYFSIMNHLEKIPSGVDDLIAKFVHEPKYQFELQFARYDKKLSDPILPYTGQNTINCYFIIVGTFELSKGFIVEIKMDFHKCHINGNFFDGEEGRISLTRAYKTYVYLERKGNIVKMNVRESFIVNLDLNVHYQWIKALVDLFNLVIEKKRLFNDELY